MRMYDLIEKKKRGKVLSEDEIRFIVEGFTKGNIPDYQMSAFLMSVYFSGMNDDETFQLTMAMAESGDRMDLSSIEGIKVDKHSTGGVGDKTTLIIGPIVASLGIPVAKMSGRGLGHTGGTIDKLESIHGFNTSMSTEEFITQVNSIYMAIAGQTANLAPADKKIYALRDVTATVDNISLIASSIMSKKLASGADAIVLDVKCGSGAFMKKEEDACKLAEAMVRIGKYANKKVTAFVTNMDEPLGRYVGNSLEVYEAVKCLMGEGDEKLMELCRVLAAQMILEAEMTDDFDSACRLVDEAVQTGKALEKMAQFVKYQGGDELFIRNPENLPVADIKIEVKAKNRGYVHSINTEMVGKSCLVLGGGRETKESSVNLEVGLFLNKKTGEHVECGETIVTIYADDENKGKASSEIILEAYEITDDKPKTSATIIKKYE